MTLQKAIERARNQFANNGRFSVLPNESINEVVSREKLPDAPGIYIIFPCDDLERPLYIGRAGTINTDGSWKGQKLRGRMTMKQGGMSRRKFFCRLMADRGLSGLTVLWFVTHNQDNKILPAMAEIELLQAHYSQYGCLPALNKCV